MGNILIMAPASPASLAVSRGTGGANLLSADPKEVWMDGAVGSPATITIDYGQPTTIDTVFLGSITSALAGATWTITAGVAGPAEAVLQVASALRVPDVAGRFASPSHALWHGAAVTARYLQIAVTQPGGGSALAVGAFMAGAAFVPTWNKEWGSGRKVIDLSTITTLAGGGFGVGEGARKGSYAWTLGDLTDAEVDWLYELQLDRGESKPVLVVEDPAMTAGLVRRIHYGRLTSLRAFERRDAALTRWEMSVEDWA